MVKCIILISSLCHLYKSLLFPTSTAEHLLSMSCHSKPLTMHHLPWSVAFCNTLYGVTLFIISQCVLAERERLSESKRNISAVKG